MTFTPWLRISVLVGIVMAGSPCHAQHGARGSTKCGTLFRTQSFHGAGMTPQKQLQAGGFATENPPQSLVMLPSALFGDWTSEAFWRGTPPEGPAQGIKAFSGWDGQKRVMDTTRKLDQWVIRWNWRGVTYFFVRFDMRRVVTDQITTASYLGEPLYQRMRTEETRPLISPNATFRGYVNLGLWKDNGPYLADTRYNLSLVQVNDSPVTGRDQITARLGVALGELRLEVPVTQLRFPALPPPGQTEPAPAWNMLVFASDLTSLKDDKGRLLIEPAEAIEWDFDFELSFKAVAPIVLVHGTDAQSDTWSEPAGDSFLDYLQGRVGRDGKGPYAGPWTHDINLGAATHGNDGIDASSEQLREQLGIYLRRFGAKCVHLVGHSKGGTDARVFIQGVYEDGIDRRLWEPPPPPRKDKSADVTRFRILSLFTLGTPHLGTVLSDIGSENANLLWSPLGTPTSTDALLAFMFASDAFLRRAGSVSRSELINPARGDALRDQKPTNMARRWERDRTAAFLTDKKGHTHYYSVAGDADANGDEIIQTWEGTPLVPELAGAPGEPSTVLTDAARIAMGTALYRTIGSYQTIRELAFWDMNPFQFHRVQFEPVQSSFFMPNDLVGTAQGAIGRSAILLSVLPLAPPKPPSQGIYLARNHSTLKGVAIAMRVLEAILSDFPDFIYDYPE